MSIVNINGKTYNAPDGCSNKYACVNNNKKKIRL